MKRNPSIEVFRCLLMFCIVLYHCCLFNVQLPDKSYHDALPIWMLPFCMGLIWHVDGFVAISGWFGIKFTLKKFFRLWGLVLFYSLLSVGVSKFVLGDALSLHSFIIYGGWFTATYLGLMFVSPVLNAAIDHLKDDPRTLRFAIGLFAAMMFLNWVPTHLNSAVEPCGVGGSTLVNFMFLYLLVRSIRVCGYRPSKRQLVMGVLLGGVGMLAVNALNLAYLVFRGGVRDVGLLAASCQSLLSYDAPYVQLIAICMLLLFAEYIQVPRILGNVCLFLGPSMFAVYLIHGPSSYGHLAYRTMQSWFLNRFDVHPAFIVVLTAVITFFACCAIDLVRRGGVQLVRRAWKVDR